MLLKKPYGLLIKYFRLIHFILLLLTILVAVNTHDIVNFFQSYVANNYSVVVTNDLASQYIASFIYFFIFLILLMFLALFVLLKYKNKPKTFYLIAFSYYTFLFIMIIVAKSLINSLNISLWETVAARQYRDFAQIIYWPQIVFIIILGVRTLGFDIKKFDFKKDIAELDLEESDSEIVEVNLEFDTTKVTKKLRRIIRELKYYFLENKFLIIIIGVIIAIFLGYKGYTNYEKLDYKYKQGESFNYGGFKLNIKDSLITNLDYNGKKLDDNKYYLLIKINFNNILKDDIKIDYYNLKLVNGNKTYTPSLDLGINFLDYSEPYLGNFIKKDVQDKNYLFTYVIDKKDIKDEYKIVIYNGFSTKKEASKKIIIKLKPSIIDEVSFISQINKDNTLNFEETYLNNTTLNIKDYLIAFNYKYIYKTCEDCQELTSFISAQNYMNNLLILDYDFLLDSTSEYSKSAQTIHSFFNHFVKIKYVLDNEEFIVNSEDITPSVVKDKLILRVPKEIEDAERIDLDITIRNKKYIINLKK